MLRRFISSDPKRFEGGLNFYAYAAGNPIAWADPTGFGPAKILDSIQTGLSVLGLTPGVGFVFDLVNAGVSAVRGDALGVATNLASAVPGVGQGVAAAKLAGGVAGLYGGYRVAKSFKSGALSRVGAGRLGQGGANGRARVLVDSNATTGLKTDATLGGRIRSGEIPVKSHVTVPEMRAAVNRGGGLRGVPRAAHELPTLTTQPSVNIRINIRGMLPAQPGRFGDGLIGGQALENNIPLITNDKALKAAVESLGGATR